MTSIKRTLAVCFVAALLAAIAVPIIAACRADSSLDINDIIDATQTKVTHSSGNNYLIFFAVRNTKRVSFMCGRRTSCNNDGITYKPALSSNVAAANPTAECRAFGLIVNAQGPVVAGFRIRFEQNTISPARKTFQAKFDTRDPNLKVTLVSVNNFTDASEE